MQLGRLVLNSSAALLSWLGRQGPRAVATLIVIGIALPPIGALFKPFVTEAVFVLLCIAFLRVDATAFRSYLRHPTMVFAATAWTAVAIPALFGVIYLALGLKERSPDLFLALALQAAAPPLMAAPALAALIGLDATFVLCATVMSTALLPFTAPLFAYVFIGPALTLSPLVLGLKLTALLAGSALVGFALRRLADSAKTWHRAPSTTSEFLTSLHEPMSLKGGAGSRRQRSWRTCRPPVSKHVDFVAPSVEDYGRGEELQGFLRPHRHIALYGAARQGVEERIVDR